MATTENVLLGIIGVEALVILALAARKQNCNPQLGIPAGAFPAFIPGPIIAGGI